MQRRPLSAVSNMSRNQNNPLPLWEWGLTGLRAKPKPSDYVINKEIRVAQHKTQEERADYLSM